MSAALDAPGIALDPGRLIALRALALRSAGARGTVSGLPGGVSVRRRGQGQDMADLREYVSGDDLRHLDPGSTARTGVVHIRTYAEERDRVTVLVADFRPAMLWGMRRAFRSVAAAEALALEGWRAAEEGGRVGALVIGAWGVEGSHPRARRRGVLDAIGAMARGHARALAAADAADPPLDRGLAPLDRLAPAGAEIVLATALDRPGDDLAGALARLGARRHLRILLIGSADVLPPGEYPVAGPDGQRFRVRIADGDAPGSVAASNGSGSSLLDRFLALRRGGARARGPGRGIDPATAGAPVLLGDVPVLRLDAGEGPERMAHLLAAAG